MARSRGFGVNPVNDYLYSILCRGSRALAGYAAQELLLREPAVCVEYGPEAVDMWRRWFAERLEELATAIAAERPVLFASRVRPAEAMLAARGFGRAPLRAALESLRSVLEAELPEPLRPKVRAYLDEAIAAAASPPVEPSCLCPPTPLGRLASEYLLTLLEGDRRQAAGLILAAVRAGTPIADICLKVLLPAQEELGRMWVAGEINVAEEHFASCTTKRLLAQLSLSAPPCPSNGKVMLAAAVADNRHDIGLQMVADFFEWNGWRVVELGADVPIDDLVQAVEYFRIDLLALSAATSTQLPTVRATIEAVRKTPRGARARILVGGPAFAEVADLPPRLGADGYTTDPAAAVALANQLVGR